MSTSSFSNNLLGRSFANATTASATMPIRLFFYFTMLTVIMTGVLSKEANPLSGQNLRVLAQEFPVSFESRRNATGHIIQSGGIQAHMIGALSEMLNFSYSYSPIIALLPDDSPSAKGGISYLVQNDADLYLSTGVARFDRFQRVDFPSAWSYWPYSTLLPYPKETENLAASFKPLSYEVWILVAISVFATMLCLKLVLGEYSFRGKIESDEVKTNGAISNKSIESYVVGNLVSQGQRYFPKRLAVRIAGGAWCCTCFFLVQIYCSTLTSHLTSPNQKPIITSFFEIADNRGVSLTIDRAYGLDKTMQTTESANLKRFVETLKKENRYITCNKTSDCLDNVRQGKSIYSAPINSVEVIVAADLKNTSKCHYTRTREAFWEHPVYFYLRKKGPYTEMMSRGVLRLQEAGLVDLWGRWNVPSATRCMKINQRTEMPRLSLKHLSSPFVILIAGYILSLTAFFIEIIVEKLARLNRALSIVVV